MNIYEKQKKKLGLTTKEYAQLLNMPYEVVKDIIYEKEGDYSMEVKNVLRNNMFNRHQEIENSEDTKIKVLEIKNKEIDYLDWYNKEYTKEMLFDKLKINSIVEFEKKYLIEVNNKKASHWFYTTIVPKISYAGHEIQKDKKREFVKQLYDIIVNDNEKQYSIVQRGRVINNNVNEVMRWYKNFDFNKYLEENHLTQLDLSKRTGLSKSTLNNLINNQSTMKYTSSQMKELYNYFHLIDMPKTSVSVEDIRKAQINGDTNKVQELKEQYIEDKRQQNCRDKKYYVIKNDKLEFDEPKPLVFNDSDFEPPKEHIDSKNEALRKLLINRLTEEKMLIELFGGKIC